MVVAGAALFTAGRAGYADSATKVGSPQKVCVGDEYYDATAAECLPNPMKITSVTPSQYSVSGGVPVVIKGTTFAAGATVLFGGQAATVSFNSDTQLTAVLPAGSAPGL